MWSLDYVEVAVDSLGEDLDHVDTLTINTETDTVQVSSITELAKKMSVSLSGIHHQYLMSATDHSLPPGDCLTSLREVVSRHKEAEAEADLSLGEDRYCQQC